MRRLLPLRTRAATLVLASTALVAGGLVAPASADVKVHPGDFTGYGFDTCHTPSQSQMDTWLTTSPYFVVGVYTSGKNRYCKVQPNLTSDWVAEQSSKGWGILPITVGLQAPCSRYSSGRIDDDPTSYFAAAREQAQRESRGSVAAARGLGIAPGSTLWLDIENYDTRLRRCNNATLTFMATWTKAVRSAGYVAGVYSSASGAVAAIDRKLISKPSYAAPDHIWFAWGNYRADSDTGPYARSTTWTPHRRVHQYHLDTTVNYGGVAMEIDKNWVDIGRGTVPGKAGRHCRTNLDYPTYPVLASGAVDERVKVAQCVLRLAGVYQGRIRADFRPFLANAVARWQTDHRLPADGRLTGRTWVSMLSASPRTPVLKTGSGNDDVRRLQRALNATGRSMLAVTGVFDSTTSSAVRAYQVRRRLPVTGVVADRTWAQLRAGRR